MSAEGGGAGGKVSADADTLPRREHTHTHSHTRTCFPICPSQFQRKSAPAAAAAAADSYQPEDEEDTRPKKVSLAVCMPGGLGADAVPSSATHPPTPTACPHTALLQMRFAKGAPSEAEDDQPAQKEVSSQCQGAAPSAQRLAHIAENVGEAPPLPSQCHAPSRPPHSPCPMPTAALH